MYYCSAVMINMGLTLRYKNAETTRYQKIAKIVIWLLFAIQVVGQLVGVCGNCIFYFNDEDSTTPSK